MIKATIKRYGTTSKIHPLPNSWLVNMKYLAVLCLIGVALALPSKIPRWGNPDEWGNNYQGDIKLPLPMMEKNGQLATRYRWPSGQVAFTYASSFQASKIPTVEQAMADYSSMTGGCVTWVPRTSETNYVEFIGDDADGCWSYVGKIGGRQNINYPQWCIDQYGSVLHEMLHALGFFHEQSTWNRDLYVTINYQNIQAGAENNFAVYDQTQVTDFGEPYDYMSVMHYSQRAFSSNGGLTIVTTDPAYQDLIGQRVGLSTIDLNKLKAMYSCP